MENEAAYVAWVPARPKRLIGRGWPRLAEAGAEAPGSLERDLALKEGSEAEPALFST